MSLPLIVTSGKYTSVYDVNGNPKVLDVIPTRGILYNDQGVVVWNDGADSGILLDSLLKVEGANDAMRHLAGFTGPGALVRWSPPSTSAEQLAPVFVNGIVKWVNISGNQVPSSGTGVMVRQPAPSGEPFNSPVFLGGGGTDNKGLILVNEDGTVQFVHNGSNGQVLKIVSNVPQFDDPAAGNVTSGGNSTGLAGVVAKSLSASSISVVAPSMTLVDGTGDEIRVAGINVSASLTASVGIGGLDSGAESSNQWYYAYIMSDGTTTGLMISTSGTSPDLTNASTYTHFALASVFRNNAAGDITPFLQYGRDFWTTGVEYVTNGTSTTAYNPVASGTNLNTILPPNVRVCGGLVGGVGGGGGETLPRITWLAADGNGLASQCVGNVNLTNITSADGFRYDLGSFLRLPIANPAAPQIFWRTSTNSVRRRMVLNSFSI